MDSTLVHHLSEAITNQDTLLNITKQLKTDIQSLKQENIFLKILPFLGVILGAVITYFGQHILKKKDLKFATNKYISESISNLFTQIGTVSFNLKELAYLEVDSKYQYYLSCIEEGEGKKRALEEHYNDYKYIADVKTKIINAISEIDASINCYYKLKDEMIPPNTITTLNIFSNHILTIKRFDGFEIPTQEEYNNNEKIVSTEMIENSIHTLFLNYDQFTINIRQIISSL